MLNSGYRRVRLGFIVSALCAMAGCGASATGAFDDKGYQHSTYGYRVDATHAPDPNVAKENLLGNDWKLDNFYYGASKKPVPKETDAYRTNYEFDFNDDGDTDFVQEDFLYDLRFKHLKRDALVWLRTMPISGDLKDKELRVLVQRYVDEVAGAGYEAVQLGPTTTLIREKRFGASVVDRGAFKLAEQDAYETTFDVGNVDDLAVNPNARRVRVRIVLVRTPFEYTPRARNKHHKYAVLMLAGYANLPQDFATDEPAFQRLLDNTVIAGKRGTTAVALEPSPNASASPVAAATPPVAPSAAATPVVAPPQSATPPSAAPPQ